MAELRSYYIEDGPRRDNLVDDLGALISMRLISLGNDGNMPDYGEPARLRQPLNPSHLGEISLRAPDQIGVG